MLLDSSVHSDAVLLHSYLSACYLRLFIIKYMSLCRPNFDSLNAPAMDWIKHLRGTKTYINYWCIITLTFSIWYFVVKVFYLVYTGRIQTVDSLHADLIVSRWTQLRHHGFPLTYRTLLNKLVVMCVRQRTTSQDCVLKASCLAHTELDHAIWCSRNQWRWVRRYWLVAATALWCSPLRRASNNSSSRTSSRTTLFQVEDFIDVGIV